MSPAGTVGSQGFITPIMGWIMAKALKLTLVKSKIGSTKKVRATLTGLGLTRTNKTIVRSDTPEIRGMVRKVQHLVRVEEIEC